MRNAEGASPSSAQVVTTPGQVRREPQQPIRESIDKGVLPLRGFYPGGL